MSHKIVARRVLVVRARSSLLSKVLQRERIGPEYCKILHREFPDTKTKLGVYRCGEQRSTNSELQDPSYASLGYSGAYAMKSFN